MHKFLIIQTSFIGDVVLATAVAEKLHAFYPNATIDFLLRKGNESLLKGHPFIHQVLVWDKQGGRKKRNLLKMAFRIRSERYTHVINLHRFGSTGFITMLSGASERIGFDKSPFSFGFTKKIRHIISEPYTTPVHETERNQALIAHLTDQAAAFPKLYPSEEDYLRVRALQADPYICIAPASVWFTKQFPTQKWTELIDNLPANHKIYLLGGLNDEEMAKAIMRHTRHRNVTSLCGSISFLQSAALMQGAAMNYVNDSAPLHFCSAVDAPVTAIFCSTVPAFGFGPLRNNGKVAEIEEKLYCRPCGLHGHKACPEGHFRCAIDIKKEQLLWWTLKTTSETV